MCNDIHNHCAEFKVKILFLVKNEKGKMEYKYNPAKRCFDSVLLHEKGVKKSLCKYHAWGNSKYGYCLGTVGENGEQLTYVREGFEFVPVEESEAEPSCTC